MKKQRYTSSIKPGIFPFLAGWTFLFGIINLFLICTVQGQTSYKVKATGTGQTTGHIANLMVHNLEKTDIRINEQSVYIPSDGRYQSYITSIPETTVPPGTTTIPLSGYCADVTTPPVGLGEKLPPIDTWITVTQPVIPEPSGSLSTVITNVLPTFSERDVPGIITSPGFTPVPISTEITIRPTWPGSEVVIEGKFNPVKDPEAIAPVLIDALENIAEAYDKLKGEGIITTPFSGTPEKERESIIQQTFWIYTAGLTGKEYGKENFNDKVFEQFEDKTGVNISAIPEMEKKQLTEGVDVFWDTFTAVGTGAKVLRLPDEESIPIQHHEDPNCIANKTYTQEYTRGQNDEHQLKTQAEQMQNGKCMYQTAVIGITWNMLSACDCDNADTHCKGEIKVQLDVEIKGLVSGDPTDHILVNAPAPTVEKRTKLIDRDAPPGQNADLLPGPNIQVNLDDEKKLGPRHFKFRKIRGQDIYKTTGVTSIPCEAGIYPVRFMIVKQNAHISIRNRKHDYVTEMTFIFDANITIAQNDCVMAEPAIESFASEFRANWDPADVTYPQKAMLKTITPKDELPQVKVNQDEKTYYNLLKLINDNGQPKGTAFPDKDEQVKRGIE